MKERLNEIAKQKTSLWYPWYVFSPVLRLGGKQGYLKESFSYGQT